METAQQLINQSQQALTDSNLKQAVNFAWQAYHRDPQSNRTLMMLEQAATQAGQFESSIFALEQLCQRLPNNAQFAQMLANARNAKILASL